MDGSDDGTTGKEKVSAWEVESATICAQQGDAICNFPVLHEYYAYMYYTLVYIYWAAQNVMRTQST